MSTNEEEVNPYELLGISIEATEQEIKTAYRQRSLSHASYRLYAEAQPRDSVMLIVYFRFP